MTWNNESAGCFHTEIAKIGDERLAEHLPIFCSDYFVCVCTFVCACVLYLIRTKKDDAGFPDSQFEPFYQFNNAEGGFGRYMRIKYMFADA